MTVPAPEAGVLMLKPGVQPTAAALDELRARVEATGHAVAETRVVPPSIVKRDALLRRHYHDHFEVGRSGTMLAGERSLLLERYGGAEARCGTPAEHIPVVGAVALAEQLGVDLAVFGRWSERTAAEVGIDTGHVDACNEVGELVDVQLLAALDDLGDQDLPGGEDGPAPVFVVNPQLGSLASWWEDGEDGVDDTTVLLLRAGPEA